MRPRSRFAFVAVEGSVVCGHGHRHRKRAHRIYIVLALDGFEDEVVGEALGAGELADGDDAAALRAKAMVRRKVSRSVGG